MATQEIPLTGHRAIQAWNPTWKHHHTPQWFVRLCRAYLRKIKQRSTLYYGQPVSEVIDILSQNRVGSLLDHHGSIAGDDPKIRPMIMQPYNSDPTLANRLAEAIGCRVTVDGPGPHHPKTTMYRFEPN